MKPPKASVILNSTISLLLKRPILIMLACYMVLCVIIVPEFFGYKNIKNYFIQCADISIFSCGLLFIMLNGGIDFSSSGVIGMGSLLIAMITNLKSGWFPNSPWAVPLALIGTLALSVIVSLINGIAVTQLKIPSFIATMSTNMILMGIALTVSMSTTISGLPSTFTGFAKGSIGIFPNLVLLALVVVLTVSVVINRTTFGRRALSVGSNPTAAYISGIPVKKTILKLFLINGILVGIGVIVFTSRMEVGKAALGENRTLDFVASVVIGGTSPSGGTATVLGTVLGAMFIMLINNSLYMLGLTWFTIMIVKGVFVIVMALVDAYQRMNEFIK